MDSLLDTVQGTSATNLSKALLERRPTARTALVAAILERRREGRPRPGSAHRSTARPPDLRRLPEMAAGAAAALTREGGEDAFRRLFRLYRQRDASDLRGVVDFSVPGSQVTLGSSCPRRTARPGL